MFKRFAHFCLAPWPRGVKLRYLLIGSGNPLFRHLGAPLHGRQRDFSRLGATLRKIADNRELFDLIVHAPIL
jgi:hypothetical protein